MVQDTPTGKATARIVVVLPNITPEQNRALQDFFKMELRDLICRRISTPDLDCEVIPIDDGIVMSPPEKG